MHKEALFGRMMAREMPPRNGARTLGNIIRNVDADTGTVEVAFQAKPEFTNPAGTIQGGFAAAMLDDAMGPAISASLGRGEIPAALNLNVACETPAKVGTIQGEGAGPQAQHGGRVPWGRAVSGRRTRRVGHRHCADSTDAEVTG